MLFLKTGIDGKTHIIRPGGHIEQRWGLSR